MGITYALLALGAWGLGDFLIQRSTRALGNWLALFYIELVGVIILTPFVIHDFSSLRIGSNLLLLGIASIVILIAALFNFEALRIGKLSVIEPVFALEVPVAVILAMVFLREPLNAAQLALVGALMFGIFLVSTESLGGLRRIQWERGIIFALVGTVAMGASNFLFGVGARATDPLMINWFTGVFALIVTTVYLLAQGHGRDIIATWRHHRALVIGVGTIDTLAWLAYAASTVYIPIPIATSISESYIALAALLGMTINHERLARHQWVGLIVCVTAVSVLAAIT